MTRIEAAIFDVGQVLHAYDPNPIYNDVVDTLGIDIELFKNDWINCTKHLEQGNLSENEYWEKFKALNGCKRELPNEPLFARAYGTGFRIFDDVIHIAKSLKKHGIKIAILSNSIESHYQFNKQKGIYDEFPIQIFSHQVGLRKPDPEIYQMAMERLQVSAQRSLFVDDKEVNIEAAKNLGMHGHLFVSAVDLKMDLLQRFGVDLI